MEGAYREYERAIRRHAAVFTFPLRDGSARLGALDLYRDTPGMLDPDAMDAAQTLADVAAAYLLNAQARVDLRDSLDRSVRARCTTRSPGCPIGSSSSNDWTTRSVELGDRASGPRCSSPISTGSSS